MSDDPLSFAQIVRAQTSLNLAISGMSGNRSERTLVRKAIAEAAAMAAGLQPDVVARKRWGDGVVSQLLQKGVLNTALLANDQDWMAAQRGFMQLERERSLLSRITGFRPAEFHTPTLNQTVRTVASFVGEGAPTPVASLDLEPVTLRPKKVSTILVATQAAVEAGGDGFEQSLTSDLVAAVGDAEAFALLDPTADGTGEAPAGLTNGVAPLAASGSDATALRHDLGRLFAAFGGDLETAVLIMSPSQALQIMLMQHPLGAVNLTLRGGDLFSIPVACSSAVPADSDGSSIVLLDPSRILLKQGDVDIDVSRQAILEVSDNPDNPSTASTVMVNLWQRNLVGFAAMRAVSWEATDGAVAWLSGTAYGEV